MELFHIHTLGTHDYSYVPNNIITVDEAFNNGIYQKMYNLNMSFTPKSLPKMFEAINKDLEGMGVSRRVDKSCIDELMHYIQFFGCDENELKIFLDMSSKIIKDYRIAMNEVSYETCRQNMYPRPPSRLHSMFACTEKGVAHWDAIMKPKKADVYRIRVSDDVLLTNPSLLPPEDSELYNKVIEAREYFRPSHIEDVDSNEYLVTGKVLIGEKVHEIRRR
jgi:hypothetical protein